MNDWVDPKPRRPFIRLEVMPCNLPPVDVDSEPGHGGIGITLGNFCAMRLVGALGLKARGGVVRVCVAHCDAAAEIDRLFGHLEEVIA